jgi:hypothetical protein
MDYWRKNTEMQKPGHGGSETFRSPGGESEMTVDFQHVGQQGAARDFPRTTGTADQGLIKFHWANVESYLRNLSNDERRNLEQRLSLSAPDGFQM